MDRFPWSMKDYQSSWSPRQKLEFLARAGVQAPSTHNIQPWLFRFNDTSLDLFLNKKLYLPESDPTERCAYISLGCCVENMVIAARAVELQLSLEFFTNEPDQRVARLTLSGAYQVPSAVSLEIDANRILVGAIRERRNIRGPFLPQPLLPDTLGKFKTMVGAGGVPFSGEASWITEPSTIKEIAALTAQGMKAAHHQKKFRREMSGLIHSNYSANQDGMPGFSLNMPGPVSLILPTALGTFNLGPILGKLNFKSIVSAPLICVLSGAEKPLDWLQLGRVGERMMLAATALGLTTSVYMAAIEIGTLGEELQAVLKTKTRPQFLLCCGFMKTAVRPLTPRYDPLEKLLTPAS